MNRERENKLMAELRDQVNDLLCAVQLLTPLVREQGETRERESLASMNQSLYRLMRTLSHMELCREEAPVFQPVTVDLARLYRDLSRQVEGVAHDLEIRFAWREPKPESILAEADRALLTQAVLSLVTNAVQAAGRGGQVSLHFAVDKGRCRFTVQDNGPGLREADPGADPLLKTPGGVGFGLEAARRVASLHGGALMLENTAGAGVRAVLSFPIREARPGGAVRSPYDRTGGFSQLLVELSPVLSFRHYALEELE